jgi:RND superfamily putative drug exporter
MTIMLTGLGRFCYVHRRAVVLAWLVVFVVGMAAGSRVFGRLGGDGGAGWESIEAYDRLADVGQYGARLTAVIDGRPIDDPAMRQAVDRLAADLAALDGVGRVVDPYRVALPDLRATDERALLVAVDLDKELSGDEADAAADAVEARLRATAADAPGTRVLVGGYRIVSRELNEQTKRDTELGEFVALPITLVVMVGIFGGLAAAGVPFLGALASIAGALLALLGFSYVLDEMDPSVVSVATVLGLGLSIDYALLMVSRYREERGQGLDGLAAIERTAATAGRTVMFSALTVATSLAGLFVFPTPIFRAIASAGVSVVVVALLAALTLTPALLGLFGHRVGVPQQPVADTGFFVRSRQPSNGVRCSPSSSSPRCSRPPHCRSCTPASRTAEPTCCRRSSRAGSSPTC